MDQQTARGLTDEAATLRGDAATRCMDEIDAALEGVPLDRRRRGGAGPDLLGIRRHRRLHRVPGRRGFAEVTDSLVIDTTELGAAAEGELRCLLVLASVAALDDVEPRLRRALRGQLSPRHVPDRFLVIDAVPRTLSGKKCEVPVKKILAGAAAERAGSAGALANPESLGTFLRPAAARPAR